MEQQPISTTLYYREGSSDKVYIASIVPANGGGFHVTYQNGRRGGTLASGSKTTTPVDYDRARVLHATLVKSKTAKGYTGEEGGQAFAGTESAGRVSGEVPQLLNVVDCDRLAELMVDPDFLMQQKFDGDRRFVIADAGQALGANRKGLTVALPANVAAATVSFPTGRTVIDGELVGDDYYPFDLIELNGVCLRALPYIERLMTLEAFLRDHGQPFPSPPTHATVLAKRAAFDALRERRAEGVVFKDRHAPYRPGRPSSGGPALKFQFRVRATVEAQAGRNGKRSFAMFVRGENDAPLFVGNCTVPANAAMPEPGSLHEIQYLYAYRTGALYQPVYVRASEAERADAHDSLQFKPESVAA